MDVLAFQIFGSELCKEAGLPKLWNRFAKHQESRAEQRANTLFSPKLDLETKWKNLPKNVQSKAFVQAVQEHPKADDKLKLHVQSMHDMTTGKTIGKVESSSGKKYEIKDLGGGGVGCTCNDWRFRGSVNPGYECKHIQAHNMGKTKVSFSAKMNAFFDELEKIRHVKEIDRETSRAKSNGSAFYNDLLQGETPQSMPSTAPPPTEPHLIIG